MELSSLLSGSDNLFKYLFTIGMVMIGISFVYPLQKKQEIEIEINSYNKSVQLLNHDIQVNSQNVKHLLRKSETTITTIDSLKKALQRNKASEVRIKDRIEGMQKEFNAKHLEISTEKQKIDINKIVIQHERLKINILREHYNTYDSYFSWLLWSGLLLSMAGLVFWIANTLKKEKLLTIEIKQKTAGNAPHSAPSQQNAPTRSQTP